MTDALPLDELILRLRARATDPERRTTSRPSAFDADVRAMDLGGLLGMLGTVSGQLRAVEAANREGRVDPAGVAAAQDLERQLTTPAPAVLPAPADAAHIAAVEARLGVSLPPALRRVYAEVADGGFGPGDGILPLAAVARQYEALRAPGAMPRGRSWPDGLLPLVAMDPGWDCVDAATGRVVAWDPDELTERSSEAVFTRSFRAIRPSVEAWLTEWVGSRTQAEVMDAQRRTMREDGGRTHIRTLQSMSAEQREAMGLGPGWEMEMAAAMGISWPPPGEER